MVRKVSSRALGIFVTAGALLGVSAVIWVGASKYFEKGARFATYFDESVQGLQRDSAVKYRGVDVGRVEEIRVAPDNRLIEVVMKIRLRDDVEKDTVASLKVAGITGIVFVELDRRDPDEPDLSPRLAFASEYPIIPSKPSQIRQIFSGIDEILEKIRQVDLEGISKSVTRSAKAAEDLLSGPRTQKVVANLESISANLDLTAARVEKITAEGRLEGIAGEARAALAEARSLIAETRDEIKALRLAETAEKANRAVDHLARTSRTTARDVQVMSDNLRRASETLERLLERLESNPSDLLFGSSPPAGRRD
ncbi:MAG TPA: MlaD family protein [Syntrophales bacterium]|nr:MlaD family protein [Syntrophales bacterium]HNS53240.1 MlaD family protein [Syntrophales bacterium]